MSSHDGSGRAEYSGGAADRRTAADPSGSGSGPPSLNRARPIPQLDWRLSDQAQRRLYIDVGPCSRLTACWWCPVCDAPVHRRYRAGRHRVYCTNACRQKAYRARRQQRIDRSFAASIANPRPERAQNRDRVHAIRDFRDALTGRRDSSGRGVTACGTFARMSIDTPQRFAHTEFRAAGPARRATTCHRCELLSGVAAPVVTPGDP